MDRLWAPWRLQYVTADDKQPDNKCMFCAKMESVDDEQNYVIERRQHVFALLNIYPYNNGHLMVVPNRHVAEIEELTDDEMLDLMKLVRDMKILLKEKIAAHGFNIGLNCGTVSGAGIADHLHFHIVPRWAGDTNFMPVLTDTRVIPQSLNALYELLAKSNR